MQCVHPRIITYRDPITGVSREQKIPCGKCIACLHNSQDAWSFRALETCKAYKGGFIYDTLTFAPANLPLADITPLFTRYRGEREISSASCKLVDLYSKGKAGFFVPCVSRGIIRDWIRRGRELFYFRHGYRLKLKYLVFMEYGPQTSRPHFHLLMWGVSYSEYVEFFAKPWRRLVGFTRTKWIDPKDKKDRECVTRYISKYCSKGVFASPLVKDGLVPKPFRCISHGVGEEYLANSIFDIFKSPTYLFFRDDCQVEQEESRKYTIFRNMHLQDLLGADIMENFRQPSEEVLEALAVYKDSQGHSHPLPRYYRQKLLKSHIPNLLSHAIQNLLLVRSESYYRKALAQFARSLGCRITKLQEQSPTFGLSRSSFNLLDSSFAIAQRDSAKAAARNRWIMLKNHYLRPLQDKAFAWAC